MRSRCASQREQRSPNPLTEAFITAGQQLGLNRIDDVNGPTQDGIGLTHVTQRNGRRCSAADAFLKPAMKRQNLPVETYCVVRKIEFVGKKAAAVIYDRHGRITKAEAAREIILCAGSIGSPQILLLSGVGPGNGLLHLGISVVADLPGVGRIFMTILQRARLSNASSRRLWRVRKASATLRAI